MGKGKLWMAGSLLAGAAAARAIWRWREATDAQRQHNGGVRVLVVGAGVVGSTYATRLARSGMDVTLLVRGARVRELCNRGLCVRDVVTRREYRVPVRAVTVLPQELDFDLAIVAVPLSDAREALQAVRPLAQTTPVLVLQNNPLGPQSLVESLGEAHVLLGFPGTAGARINGVVHSLPFWLGSTVIGESDGSHTQRLQQTAHILRRAGLTVEVHPRIVSWLRTQAALMSVLAGCVNRSGGSLRMMAHEPDMVRLYLGALREAYAALVANGIPVTPSEELRILDLPYWVQSVSVRSAGWWPWAAMLVDRYVQSAADEMATGHLELLRLAQTAGLDTPLLSSLSEHYRR